MKNNVFRKFMGVMLAMILVVSSFATKEAAAVDNGYVAITGTKLINNVAGVDKVKSMAEFQTYIDMGGSPAFVAGFSNNDIKSTVNFKESGYFIVRGTTANVYSGDKMVLYRDSAKTSTVASCYMKKETKDLVCPVEKGTYYFEVYDMVSLYIAFIPASSVLEVHKRTQANGSVYIDITAVEKDAPVKANALDGTVATKTCNATTKWDYDAVVEKGTASILVPEEGKYTVKVVTASGNVFVYQIDTKDLTTKTREIPQPISILANTNLIVGYAEPNVTVFAEYAGIEYSAKADSNGLYRLCVGKMKKNKSVKMWMVVDGSKVGVTTFKVVKKY